MKEPQELITGETKCYASEESVYTNDGEEGHETEIDISIDSIENIIRNDNFQIKIVVEHQDIVLGQSDHININTSYENKNKLYPVNFIATLPYSVTDLKSVAPIVSSPVLIKVFEVTNGSDTPSQIKGRQSREKNQLKPKRSSKIETKLLGLCNIDLLPIVLGEKTYEEKLLLEIPSYSWDGETVSWENLPRILVSTCLSGQEMASHLNFLNITVESIYNLPPNFTDQMEYKCGTILHTDDVGENSRIEFTCGQWKNFHDIEKMKIWRSLQELDSRAKFSKYRINCDYDAVINHFKKKFDLKTTAKRNVKRIEWNAVHRTVLDLDDVQKIQDRLRKYKFWPFEILVTEKLNGESRKNSLDTYPLVYQVYADASQLMFPGRTKARILCQLYGQNTSELREHTGLEVNIFNEIFGDTKSSESKLSYDNLETAPEEEMMMESVPIFTEDGDPVLVLIEFELYRPFVQARVLEDYKHVMEVLRSKPRPSKPLYSYTPDLAHDQYINCIKLIVDVLSESYRDFTDQCDCQEKDFTVISESKNLSVAKPKCGDKFRKPCPTPPPSQSTIISEDITCPYFYLEDELSRFKQFLHESGKYVSIRSTLKNKIINLLDQKFASNSSDWCSSENQHLIASCYTYLVEKMHVALNTKLEVRLAKEIYRQGKPVTLWLRAEEAYECCNHEKADNLLTKMISLNKCDAEYWVLYAIHFARISDSYGAIESCREAIRLNSRHKIALLFYGVILAMKDEYTDAEIFLKAVTHFYPRFAYGWAVLHLFYIKIQYYPGIDLTLEFAEKCLKDKYPEGVSLDILDREPMAWSTMICRKNRIFLLTAALLLKLNLYSFAGLALAQELCHGEKSVEFLYYISVNYYLQGNYECALEHLKDAALIIGLDYSVNALMGHCYYKCGSLFEAIEHYESVDMLYERPENIHLVHLRMGFHYIDCKDYERARNVFLRACKHSPSCKTWLGVGIANYHLEQFEESEIALMEANRIDGEDAEVWAYLCLLNLSLNRYDEFTQCYRQTVKNNLRSDKLWRLITHSMDTSGYSSPIIVIQDVNDKCDCSN